jgi:hypothetical protein
VSNAAFDDSLREPAPPKSNKTCLIVLLILGGLLLGCLCCGGLAYWGFRASAGQVGTIISSGVADNEVIQEHIGEIQSSEVLWMESIQYVAESGKQNYFILDLKGSKGNGKLTIHVQENGAAADVETGELTLPDGTVVPLVEPPAAEGEAEEPAAAEPAAPAEALPGTN